MTLASILVPGLLIGLGVVTIIFIAARVGIKYSRMLDARRKVAEAPFRLLRQQDDVICAMITETENLVSQELRDRMIKAHDSFREIERGTK